MNKIIHQDILTIDHGIICQQVNCQGVMGAGLAKQIAGKWPVVKESYLRACKGIVGMGDYAKRPEVGDYCKTQINYRLIVFNIFGQESYGRKPGYVYTSYRGLAEGFYELAGFAKHHELPIYIPHGIGCGLAGGDWHVVSALIEQELPDAIICKLPD